MAAALAAQAQRNLQMQSMGMQSGMGGMGMGMQAGMPGMMQQQQMQMLMQVNEIRICM